MYTCVYNISSFLHYPLSVTWEYVSVCVCACVRESDIIYSYSWLSSTQHPDFCGRPLPVFYPQAPLLMSLRQMTNPCKAITVCYVMPPSHNLESCSLKNTFIPQQRRLHLASRISSDFFTPHPRSPNPPSLRCLFDASSARWVESKWPWSLTCVPGLWAETTSRIRRSSEGVTPPTRKRKSRPWSLWCDRLT